MGGHHLILGELTDYLTGETLPDTHDERYRQKLAKLLVEEKGFLPDQIIPRTALTVSAGEKNGRLFIDLLVTIGGRTVMLIKYGPGSLVTRERPVIAMSRIVTPYQIPVAVITNGEDAHVMEGATGTPMGNGLKSIPDAISLSGLSPSKFSPIDEKRRAMESRIVYAYEIDGSCPCDDTVCRLTDMTEED